MAPTNSPIPDKHAEAILAEMQAEKDARARRDQAIVKGLLAGGSVRAMHALTGLSTSTIVQIGHAGGWPSAEFKRQRADTAERNKLFADLMSMDPAEAARLLRQARGEQAGQ